MKKLQKLLSAGLTALMLLSHTNVGALTDTAARQHAREAYLENVSQKFGGVEILDCC